MKKVLVISAFIFLNVFFFVLTTRDSHAQNPVTDYQLRVTNYAPSTTANAQFYESINDGSGNYIWQKAGSVQTLSLSQSYTGVLRISSLYGPGYVAVSYWTSDNVYGSRETKHIFLDLKDYPEFASETYCIDIRCINNWTIGQPPPAVEGQCGMNVDNNGDGEVDEFCKSTSLNASSDSCSFDGSGNVLENILFSWNAAQGRSSAVPLRYTVWLTDFQGKEIRYLGYRSSATYPTQLSVVASFTPDSQVKYWKVITKYGLSGATTTFTNEYDSNIRQFTANGCQPPLNLNVNLAVCGSSPYPSVTFSWTTRAGSGGYVLEINDSPWNDGTQSTKTFTPENTSSFIWNSLNPMSGAPNTPQPALTYYWRMKAANGSNYIYPVNQTGPPYASVAVPLCPPTGLSSTNGCLSNIPTVTMNWNAVSGAAKYDLEVSRTNFGSTPMTKTASSNSFIWNPGTLSGGNLPLDGKIYYWRVKSVSSTGIESVVSLVSNFTTQNCVATPPPTNLQRDIPACTTSATYTAEFTWNNQGSGWTLQVSTSSTFASILASKNVSYASGTSSSGWVTLNSGATTYYWRITGSGFSPVVGPSFNVQNSGVACVDLWDDPPACSNTTRFQVFFRWNSTTVGSSPASGWHLDISNNGSTFAAGTFSRRAISGGRINIEYNSANYNLWSPAIDLTPNQTYYFRIWNSTTSTVVRGPRSSKVPFCSATGLGVTNPSCSSDESYVATFNWTGRGVGWKLDISTNNFASTLTSADISTLVTVQSNSYRFNPAFEATPATTYYWRIVSIYPGVSTPTPYSASGGSVTTNGTSFSVPTCATTGWLDATGNCWASGWALDPNKPLANIYVHFYRDGPAGVGTFVGFYQAAYPRADVNTATSLPGNHGFGPKDGGGMINFAPTNTSEVEVPGGNMGMFDGNTHSLYAYGISETGGANTHLLGSPKNIQCFADLKIEISPLDTSPSVFDSGANATFLYRVTNYGNANNPLITLGFWPTTPSFAFPNCKVPPNSGPQTPPISTTWGAIAPGTYADIPVPFLVGIEPGTKVSWAEIIPFCGFAESGSVNHWDDNFVARTYLVNANTWFETTGGDVGSETAVSIANTNPPRNSSQYLAAGLSLQNLDARWAMKNYKDEQMVNCAQNNLATGCVYNYFDYFQKFRQTAIELSQTPGQTDRANCDLPNANKTGFFYCAGPLNYNGGISGPKGNQIWFVDGNFTVQSNLIIDPGDTFVFVVQGEVIVNTGVTRADGMYVTGSTFYDYTKGSTYAAAGPLTVAGAVYAKNVDLKRYLSAAAGCSLNCDNAQNAALIINYPAARYIYQLRDYLGSPVIFWNEVAP